MPYLRRHMHKSSDGNYRTAAKQTFQPILTLSRSPSSTALIASSTITVHASLRLSRLSDKAPPSWDAAMSSSSPSWGSSSPKADSIFRRLGVQNRRAEARGVSLV